MPLLLRQQTEAPHRRRARERKIRLSTPLIAMICVRPTGSRQTIGLDASPASTLKRQTRAASRVLEPLPELFESSYAVPSKLEAAPRRIAVRRSHCAASSVVSASARRCGLGPGLADLTGLRGRLGNGGPGWLDGTAARASGSRLGVDDRTTAPGPPRPTPRRQRSLTTRPTGSSPSPPPR